jgi:uncharacterized protein (TIGR04442 family)
MIHDISLHGTRGSRYEFFTTVIGPSLSVRYFHDSGTKGGQSFDRFFSGESEIRLFDNRLTRRGSGGTLCAHMFGVERPATDAVKREVLNRLIVFGVRHEDGERRLLFTDDTAATEAYDQVFQDGHILTNYFFFVSGEIQGGVRGTQEMLLRMSGRFLKRYDLDADTTGRDLAFDLYRELGVPNWTLFLVRLDDIAAHRYARMFRAIYQPGRAIRSTDRAALDRLALDLGLPASRYDRIETHVIARHPENRTLIDQYEETFTSLFARTIPEKLGSTNLSRLRALAARKKLPSVIFDRIDRKFSHRHNPENEPDYVAEMRRRLRGLFIDGAEETPVDLLEGLMEYKRCAVERHSTLFDEALDTLAHEVEHWRTGEENESAMAAFSAVLSHFQRYDELSAIVNGVAFIDDYDLTEERVGALAEHRIMLETMRPGLFNRLYFEPLLENRYLNRYGRERLELLRDGIRAVVDGDTLPNAVTASNAAINRFLALHRAVDLAVRSIVKDIHNNPPGKDEQVFLRNAVTRRLMNEKLTTDPVSEDVLSAVLAAIREEALYLNELLPLSVATQDRQVREDFLENSSLDRFRIEELERDYLKREGLPSSVLAYLEIKSLESGVESRESGKR